MSETTGLVYASNLQRRENLLRVSFCMNWKPESRREMANFALMAALVILGAEVAYALYQLANLFS